MGWIETPKNGVLGICNGCANGRECEVAELTACKTLRDEYVRGWGEAVDVATAALQELGMRHEAIYTTLASIRRKYT